LAYAITLIGLLIWFVILYTHVQFRKKIGNEGLRNLAYRSKLWPYSSWIAATMLSVVMVMLVLTKEAIYPLVILAILFIICISSYFLYIKKMNN
jgi:L-asparagine transporter-like permease